MFLCNAINLQSGEFSKPLAVDNSKLIQKVNLCLSTRPLLESLVTPIIN